MTNLPQKPLENQGQFVAVFNGDINRSPELLCNARELHKFLGVGRKFNTWIKDRINEYGFVENQDYVLITENLVAKNDFTKKSVKPKATFSQNGEKVKMGRPTIDYHITLDMAKELAMVEKNTKGRAVRRYFIDCEKRAMAQNHDLLSQFNKAVMDFEKLEELASQAGRALSVVGKQLKPKAKNKVITLQAQLQIALPQGE